MAQEAFEVTNLSTQGETKEAHGNGPMLTLTVHSTYSKKGKVSKFTVRGFCNGPGDKKGDDQSGLTSIAIVEPTCDMEVESLPPIDKSSIPIDTRKTSLYDGSTNHQQSSHVKLNGSGTSYTFSNGKNKTRLHKIPPLTYSKIKQGKIVCFANQSMSSWMTISMKDTTATNDRHLSNYKSLDIKNLEALSMPKKMVSSTRKKHSRKNHKKRVMLSPLLYAVNHNGGSNTTITSAVEMLDAITHSSLIEYSNEISCIEVGNEISTIDHHTIDLGDVESVGSNDDLMVSEPLRENPNLSPVTFVFSSKTMKYRRQRRAKVKKKTKTDKLHRRYRCGRSRKRKGAFFESLMSSGYVTCCQPYHNPP